MPRKSLRKVLATAAGAALFAVAGTAQAITIQFNQVVTGNTPASSAAPWLTATVTNNNSGGVRVTLSTSLINPEFITSIYFALNRSSYYANPSTNPDIDGRNCSGDAPAGTGPWQMCFRFNPNLQWDGPSVSFTLANLRESNFIYNSDGWRAVAHVQGIQPDCSGWIGDYNGTGRIAPSGDGRCGGSTSVPEPATLGLLGLGLAALGLGIGRRRTI